MSLSTNDLSRARFSGLLKSEGMAVPRALSLGLTALVFFLIALGGLVRNAGAGLSCPDWPLCFGRFVPPMDVQVFLEWFHRLIAGSVSVLLIGLSVTIFGRGHLRARYGWHCALALALLAAQVVLGGLTVLGLLSPKWVSSHLAVGQAFFGTILLLTLRLRDHDREAELDTDGVRPGALARTLAPVAAVTVYAQMILGGLVSSNYAGLACPDFPTCNGSWLPTLSGLVLFQFAHRGGAVIATAAVLALCVAAWGRSVTPRAHAALRALPLLLTIQVLLGVGSVILKLPLPMSVAHLGTAAALFGTLLVTSYEIRY